jgi:hypothetical protein
MYQVLRSQVLPALADDDIVTFLDTEARGDVSRNVGVPLLVPARCKVTSFLENIKFHLEENMSLGSTNSSLTSDIS